MKKTINFYVDKFGLLRSDLQVYRGLVIGDMKGVFMKTRITELFGITYPILLSGMSWISVPKMVAAVSNAGGLGILATGPLSTKQVRKAIHEVRYLTDRPFGANAPLLNPNSIENAKVLLDEEVPVINFALGKGDWLVKAAHEYGGKVVATVVNPRHAKRAQDYGSDAVISTGHEAAAHGDTLTTFVLVPVLADILKIPVVAAGGIGDGRGLAAALALGADGVAMGTRFMTTKESTLHDVYKRLSIEKEATETLFSDRFDGMLSRVMKTEGATRSMKQRLNLCRTILNAWRITKQMELSFGKLFMDAMTSGWTTMKRMALQANAFNALCAATQNGDTDNGYLPVGQVIGLVHDEPTVAELIERIVSEAKDIQQQLQKKMP